MHLRDEHSFEIEGGPGVVSTPRGMRAPEGVRASHILIEDEAGGVATTAELAAEDGTIATAAAVAVPIRHVEVGIVGSGDGGVVGGGVVHSA